MCHASCDDYEIEDLLKAEADVAAARDALDKSNALLAGIPKIMATVKLPHECEQCGQHYIPLYTDSVYICSECRDENASARDEDDYESSHSRGPI